MFKKLMFIMSFSTLLLQVSNLSAENNSAKPSIKWFNNYDEAVKQAKTGNKPLVLLFTGSDWCTWCTKLEEESFGSNDFANAAGAKFVFVKLDFPLYSPQDAEIKVQNKQLQQKFDVRNFPTVILYDPVNNQTIGTTGYRPGGGKQYAEFLNKLLNDYSSYKQKVGSVDKGNLSGADLKTLYEQSLKLSLKSDAKKITNMGVDSDLSLFFLTERYRQHVANGQIHSGEAITLRQQLLAADPHNERRIPYQIALIEFDAYTNRVAAKSCSPEMAVSPLNGYIEKFGGKDRETVWKLHMIIAQVYLDSCQLNNALKYAQLAYDSAPVSAQQEIDRVVQAIKAQTNTPSILSLHN